MLQNYKAHRYELGFLKFLQYIFIYFMTSCIIVTSAYLLLHMCHMRAYTTSLLSAACELHKDYKRAELCKQFEPFSRPEYRCGP